MEKSFLFILAIIMLCLTVASNGLNKEPIARTSTISRINTQTRQPTTIEQSLAAIIKKLEQNHNELQSSMRDVMRVARQTQREVANLQEDMELLLEQMYKPSCQEIAQDHHQVLPTKTNDASIGVFTVKPPSFKPTEVRCEIERGGIGWTVMLSRTSAREPFNRTYKQYQEGFGDPSGDYWVGLDFLHKLTTWRPHQLRAVMDDWDGQKTWVQYNLFRVAGPDENYRLTVEQFEADSAAGDGFNIHNGMTFSTFDKDDDNNNEGNCAQLLGGDGGWWYNNCYHVLPTGRYRSTGGTTYGGIAWFPWRSVKHSLKAITLLLRSNVP